MTASRRYKEIVAGIADAAETLRAADRERAAALSRRLVELEAVMSRADAGAAYTRLGVELSWENAMEELWVESWMTLHPRPGPDPTADPADLAQLDAAVAERSQALQDAVRRSRPFRRR